MPDKISRELAETCVAQIQLMYPDYREEKGFGKPVPSEDPDNEGCWVIRWTEGPYLFGCVPVRIPEGRPNGGVRPAPAWPEGVAVESVDNQAVRLRPA